MTASLKLREFWTNYIVVTEKLVFIIAVVSSEFKCIRHTLFAVFDVNKKPNYTRGEYNNYVYFFIAINTTKAATQRTKFYYYSPGERVQVEAIVIILTSIS